MHLPVISANDAALLSETAKKIWASFETMDMAHSLSEVEKTKRMLASLDLHKLLSATRKDEE